MQSKARSTQEQLYTAVLADADRVISNYDQMVEKNPDTAGGIASELRQVQWTCTTALRLLVVPGSVCCDGNGWCRDGAA